MKIAVHSDLHTEVSGCELEGLAQADILLLAGDIGNETSLPAFYETLRKSAPKLPVYYVLGNHDRYGYTRSGGVAMQRALGAKYDVQILDNEALMMEDVLICGTTLWTDFELAGNPLGSMTWAEEVLPDFKLISADDGTPLTAALMVDWFAESCQFLQKSLAQEARQKIVVSHFLPARELVAETHKKNEEEFTHSAYWASDIPRIFRLADIWIYGHSHDNIECRVGRTQFICNQRGYSKKTNGHEHNGYQPNYLIEV